MSFIVLEGGAEFGGRMEDPDRLALLLAGGAEARIRIVPTAAAPDNNHRQAGQNGTKWFKRLGASDVVAVPLIDTPSANDPTIVKTLSRADLIYLPGGFPRYLAQTLMGSRSWEAILQAHRKGAVIAGSSAGAMVLCEYYYDPGSVKVREGLGLIKGTCVLPHHNTFGRKWVKPLMRLMPKVVLLGIDEETGFICDIKEKRARAHGKGMITLYHNDLIHEIGPGQAVDLPLLTSQNLP